MDKYYDIVKVDERQAERENIRLLNLIPEELAVEREQAEMKKMEVMAQLMLSSGAFQPEEINEESIEFFSTNDPQAAQMSAQFDRAFISPNDFDNHEVHIEVHNRVRKSQEYETADPAIKDEFDRHVAEHEQRLQQKQLEDMMFNGGMAGDPNEQMMIEEGAGEEEEAPEESGSNQFSGVEEPPADSMSEQSPGIDTMPAVQ